MKATINELIENVNDSILSEIILENLIAKGSINIEEALYLSKIVKQVITETSELAIPDENEIATAEENKMVLVDPETGDSYVYNSDTGTLTPIEGDDTGTTDPQASDEILNENEALVNKLLKNIEML